jgi:hypothetical protein
MKKYSNGYIGCMLLGVVCALNAIWLMVEEHSPGLCAVMSVSAFIFLWVPQMFPDSDKYRKHTYTGNEKRHRESSGSN